MDLAARFRQSLTKTDLSSARILLAVSGGVDSMVMLHLFSKEKIRFGVAHCNFQLRGEESDGDEAFVRQCAETLCVPCYVKRFDTKDYADKNGVSIQMAARELRYAWFAETAQDNDYQFIATAHNLNDSVETVLLNFVRGTGISGMTGIRSTVAGSNERPVIRPLLFAERAEILEYAHLHNIAWREDSSNASDDYARNFLRHEIVPRMQELNPAFLHTAERNLMRFQETKDNLDFLTRQFLGIESIDSGRFSIELQKLAQLPAPQRALRDILKPCGFTEEQARQTAENLNQTGFELTSSKGWRLLCDRREIIVRAPDAAAHAPVLRVSESDLMLRLPGGGSLFLMPTDAAPPYPDGSESVLIDASKLVYPLSLRRWQDGDVFQPFGMGGQSQKLQDYFTNRKLSRIEKELVWLLLNGDGTTIWLLGMRLDERFRIGPEVSKALKISWVK